MKRCLGCFELFDDELEVCPYCGYIEGTEAEEAIHMTPGTILSDRYIIGKVLGYGGFGVTYIGWDGKLEQKVAIKEYLPSEFSTRMPGQSRVTAFNGDKNEQFMDGLRKFVEEAKRLAKFQSEPGIVKVYDSFVENDTAYIIMEYLDGETLTSKLKRDGTIPEDEAVQMLLPIMESLKIVHDEGILHRDIAPDNIFITKNGDIKLIDFGASRYATTSHTRSLTVIIKPGYSPEEQYRSSGDQGPYTDVYALGACLYKMITGKTPPDAMIRRAQFESKNKDILDVPHKYAKDISLIRETAILNAMNVRIEDRTPDVQTFINELNSDTPVRRKNGRIKKIDIYGWPIWFKVVAALILISTLSFGALMATGVIRVDGLFSTSVDIPEGMVQVPLVEGISSSKATSTIERRKLNVAIVGSVTSPYVPAGKIVLQEPASGMLCEEYSTVSLKISRGNGEVIKAEDGKATVPSVVGDTAEEAASRLAEAGLATPEIEYVYDDNFAAGLVIKQSKNEGTSVKEGAEIKITVSKGSKAFDMPNVVGLSYSEAQKTLSTKGLIVEKEQKATGRQAEGTVLNQSVAAGTQMQRGNTVLLIVAVTPQWVDCTTLPDFVANNRSEYEIEEFYEYRSRGKVTVTNPAEAGGDWELISTEEYDTGEFSEWSEWSESNNIGNNVESRTAYKYKVIETTWNSSASLGGWTATGNKHYSDWGENQTSKTRPEDSDTCENTGESHWYTYYHWDCKTNAGYTSSGWWCYDSNVNGAGAYHEHGQSTPLYHNGSYYEGPKCGYGFLAWWLKSDDVTYNFHTRSISEYEYTRKSDWKDSGTDTPPDGAVDVTAYTQYRYRTPIIGTKYTYWGSFSGWSSNVLNGDGNTQVESRIASYRYKEK